MAPNLNGDKKCARGFWQISDRAYFDGDKMVENLTFCILLIVPRYFLNR